MSVNRKRVKVRKPFIIFFLIFWAGTAVASNSNNDLWHKANELYTQKQYDSALVYYNRLLQSLPENPALHYNIGNAHYRLNHVGLAILHFEKSLRFEPDNKQAQDNLSLANARIQNPLPAIPPIFFVRWWEQLVQTFSSNTWAWLTFLFFAGILAVIYYRQTLKERFTNSGRWIAAAIVLFVLSGGMTCITYMDAGDSGKAVVLDAAATLIETPQLTGKVMNSIPEGTVLEVYARQGQFLNVKLPNGRMGWVQNDLVAPV